MSRDQTPTTPTTPDAARSWLSGGSAPSAPSQDLTPPTGQQPPAQSITNNAVPESQQPKKQHTNSTYIPISTALSSIKPEDFLSVHETPCARQGFMTGIGSGASIGVLRWIMGLPIPKAANWGVGCGIVGAMAQYEYCQWQRRKEKEKMQRVVAVYTKKQAESRAKEAKEARERREKAAELEGKGEEGGGGQRKKSWYKFW
ncbi:hypothetical protein SMACR_06070 [Sordaria macrospora]|uniref:Cytochrome c oxidase assembly protein COX20, mitochondrial n=2 Tax=Sordaria macrospora TaxID=5147 RepID=F7W5Z0_SORMK|nr:uncharacterized protein SMAC_06070 [Sordaria macrospora k-hell]KAA8629550.1 hypothetical protein SMACR_06070 [Sordaria macrospora]KAH7628158.1 hypothetical protein B0T09DRAFT_323206 [Sordaria sp. MPI-SDFR-AT-0083]WPJ65613.1 hypothetical protein SMAC4_06070 [Sordaria macrospora]CCC12928.1 unnamed protein product [Sordaria macrospora k-hell]